MEKEKRGKNRISVLILVVIVLGICVSGVGCGNSPADTTATDVSSNVSELENAVSTVSQAEVSKPSEESKVETVSKPAQTTETIPLEPFVPQGNISPTDIKGKVCYLTFDDGPSDNTLKILDILKKYNVKATFFVVGSGKLEYTKRMVAEGHTVALHCNNHDYSKVYASPTAYYNDLKTLSSKVEKACGVKSNIVRFPGGTSNTMSKNYCSGIMSKISKELPGLGYCYFDWNVDSGDANGNNVPVSKLVSNIKSSGTSKKSVVVLMHDTAAKNTTVQALPQIIQYYINAGYYLAPLSPNSEPIRHKPNN